MALFGKLFGGGGDSDAPKREFDRIEAAEETVTIKSTETSYGLVDFSPGGFCLKDYEGELRGNQYFDFKFTGNKDGEEVEAEGVAIVVRVKKNQLAAKFPPQPRLRNFFKDYLR